jgi:NAD(P) transhydrogenase
VSHAAEPFDVVVLGSGPAGQKAAVQAAKAGRSVCLVERDAVGGACVHHGTIPSKTLRETAVHLAGFRVRAGRHVPVEIPPDLQLQSLMDRKDAVVDAHVAFLQKQMERNGIVQRHGRARFVTPHVIEVESVYGDRSLLRGSVIVIATGSRPRAPEGIPIDHERVLDSDSILSLSHVPRSMTVLGSGVIACEYATIFAALGVRVTIVDKGKRPLNFLPASIVDRFVSAFERNEGCVFVGNATVRSVQWNGVDAVVTQLDNGWEAKSDVLLCALGRVANVEGLGLENAGLATNARGHIPVDADCRTSAPHIFAVGDVIGPPSLASASMEQGRRAMRAALSLPRGNSFDMIPAGIYTIPEIATIGIDADSARAQGIECVVGTARFDELARGQIAACTEGVLHLVVDCATRRIRGCQVLGEGATELVHLAQMAMATGASVETFVDGIFNFPTMAEAYRVAALDADAQLLRMAQR